MENRNYSFLFLLLFCWFFPPTAIIYSLLKDIVLKWVVDTDDQTGSLPIDYKLFLKHERCPNLEDFDECKETIWDLNSDYN